ncbi:MAG: peptidoglycan-binding protein, partial [Candidatus Gallimonas sp.]
MKKFLAIGALTLALSVSAAAGITAVTVSRTDGVAETALNAIEAAVLRQGSTGGEVKEVQRRLKEWGYY